MKKEKLEKFLNRILRLEDFEKIEDAKFNGVLVEGNEEVEKVGLCTNCTFENIEKAEELGCDLVISHHGGWKVFDQDLLEEKKERIKESGMTWYIAHETLDCAKFGVSASLAEKLGIEIKDSYAHHAGGDVGVYGTLSVSEEDFEERLEDIEDDFNLIGKIDDIGGKKIGVVGGSGGAFGEIMRETTEIGCEVFITGNTAFFADIYAYEKGITLIELEETSSEKWGVYSLGDKIRDEFQELEVIEMQERNW